MQIHRLSHSGDTCTRGVGSCSTHCREDRRVTRDSVQERMALLDPAAKIVEGHPDMMEGWGILAMSKEACRIMSKYARLLLPFILAFLLPVILMQLLEMIGLVWLLERLGPHTPPLLFGGISDHHHHHRHHHHHHHHHFGFHAFSAFAKGTNDASQLPPPIVLSLLLLTYALAILMWLLSCLGMASIAKVVQYIYSDDDKDPAIVRSIFRSLPGVICPLFVTSLWIFLVDFVAYFLVSLPFFLVSAAHVVDPQLLGIVHEACLFVVLLFVNSCFLLVLQVVALEPEMYGRAALKRSVQLLQAKAPTALAFVAVELLVNFSVGSTPLRLVLQGNLPLGLAYVVAVVAAFVYLAFTVYWSVVMSVLYFACKLKCQAEEQVLPAANPYQPLAGNDEAHSSSSLIG